MPDSLVDPPSAHGTDPLAPLLCWSLPLYEARCDRALAAWRDAARRQPHRFDAARLERSVRSAFAAPALSWSRRALLMELAIARHGGALPGDSPQSRLGAFLDWMDSGPGRATIDARYPTLAADVRGLSAQVGRFLDGLLARLQRDGDALAPLLPEGAGQLTGFALGQGDRHDHGGSVVTLDFERGRAVYKPRPMAMDVAWRDLFGRLAGAGVEPVQRATASLDRGDYGYAAWVGRQPLADAAAAARYYARFGGLAALAYVFNGSDLHLENLVASGEYPVLVDLETVFQPWISRYARTDRHGVPYAPTVLVSGLLPGQLSRIDAWDISALAWDEHRYAARVVAGAGTDQLRLAPGEAVTPPSANVPYLADGRRVPSHDYAADIVDGFERTYRGLHACRPRLRGAGGWLAPFARLPTRTVLRSTQIYARLLDALSHPQFLRSAQARDDVLGKLAVGGRKWPALVRTEPVERAALARGDVPRFAARVDGVDVADGDGHVVAGLCDTSGWREVQRRLRRLGERDLHRQRYAVAQALECDRLAAAERGKAPRRGVPPVAPIARGYAGGGFLDTAVALGDDLLRLGFGGHGGLVFFQPEYRDGDQPAMSGMGPALYEGLAGVTLTLVQLGRHSGLDRFVRAGRHALTTCRRLVREDPGALAAAGPFGGRAGWLFTLASLGRRLHRDDLWAEARAELPTLVACIEGGTDFDLIGGAAGSLLVLSAVYEQAPDEAVLAAARACVASLRATAVREGDTACWTTAAEAGPLTGFAHGTAGVVAALLRFGEQAGDGDALDLAAAALRFERQALAARAGRWYDRSDGEGGEDICSWCHGAPGSGLARLLWPGRWRDAAWRDEVARCAATVRREGLRGTHALCHGQLGNLELPLVLAVQTGDEALLAEARAMGRQVLDGARDGWCYGGGSLAQEPLGLMTGLAGLVYGCLRLACPRQVPSVLSLEL